MTGGRMSACQAEITAKLRNIVTAFTIFSPKNQLTVSHDHIRKERDCLNCGTVVTGQYCQECGQKNVEPRQSLWHLITHFFNDLTHFDGKFFLTLKLLIIRPGFVSEEYVKGRRTKYL